MRDLRWAPLTVLFTLALTGCAGDRHAGHGAAAVDCTVTLKDYCTFADRSSPLCVGDLDQARVWCSDATEAATRQQSLTPSACSGYFMVSYRDQARSYSYYYDASSGQLAAVFAGADVGALGCVAGPPHFHPVECPQLTCVRPADGVAAAQNLR